MNNQMHIEPATAPFVDLDFALPSMQELILEYLAMNAAATFVDLEDEVPGFSGGLPFKAFANRSTILWQGVSAAAVHALHELETQGKIQFEDTSFHTYQQKGRRLYLPVDGRESDRLHWTPVLVKLKGETH